jgi:putative acetyltransferase
MNRLQNTTIVPFKPAYQAEAKNLILAGLVEHWGTLDPTKNPDLDDISSSYANGQVLVAIHDEEVIGTGAIVPKDNKTAEIVRMSVATNMRRKGIGKVILNQLCDYARSIGCRRVVLETTDSWHEVIAFYKRYGFQITHYLDGDVYFALDL